MFPRRNLRLAEFCGSEGEEIEQVARDHPRLGLIPICRQLTCTCVQPATEDGGVEGVHALTQQASDHACEDVPGSSFRQAGACEREKRLATFRPSYDCESAFQDDDMPPLLGHFCSCLPPIPPGYPQPASRS